MYAPSTCNSTTQLFNVTQFSFCTEKVKFSLPSMLHHLTPMHHPKRRQLPLLLDPFWEIYLLDLSFLKPWSLSQLQGLYLFSNSTRRDRSLHHHRIFQCNYLIFCMHHHHCCTMVGVKFQNHHITLTPCKGWRKSGLYLKLTLNPEKCIVLHFFCIVLNLAWLEISEKSHLELIPLTPVFQEFPVVFLSVRVVSYLNLWGCGWILKIENHS